MSVRIAVVDPLPMFRHGITQMLGHAAYEAEDTEDLLAWVHDEPPRIVLLTLHSAEEWALLTRIRERSPEIIIVAMLPDAATENYVRAILSGASAVLPRDASPEFVRRAFEEAVNGRCVLPIEVVQALPSSGLPQQDGGPEPSPQELRWLRQLAGGATIARLANEAGYSERAMFRLLGQLYRRMGVRNRTEALLHASQRGWL